MAEAYNISISGIQELIGKLNAATKDQVMTESISYSAKKLTDWIKVNRLTGTRATLPADRLGLVSGRLRSSISSSIPEKTNEGYQVRIGTNVEYAAIHEYGGTIKRHARTSLLIPTRFKSGPRKGKFKEFRMWGSQGGFTYKAGTTVMPKRPFLAPALEDAGNRKMVLNTLSRRINKALREGK